MPQRVTVRSGFLALFLTTPALSVSAQMIRGRILLADSTPAPSSIVITAIDSAGVAKARGITNAAGRYAIAVAPGRYKLRVLRIGYVPVTTKTVESRTRDTVNVDVVLTSQAVVLPAVSTVGADRCGLHATEGAKLLSILEQARAALASSSSVAESGELDLFVARLDGVIDRDGTHFEVDSESVRQHIVNRPPWTTPASTLAQQGYVRGRDDHVVYDAPSAEAILSDEFIAEHCFSVRTHPTDTALMGLAFQPIETRPDFVDINGVFWLDNHTAELREIEFTYADRDLAGVGCSSIGMCWRARGGLGAGGTLTYRHLASGEWLISRWVIRTPADAPEWRRGSAVAVMPPNAVARRGRAMTLRPRLTIAEGAIAIAWRHGVQIYRDDSVVTSINSVAAKTGGRHPGSIEGRVFDPDGRPVSRAVIEIADPSRVALTDSSGVFRIQSLPARTLKVVVHANGFQPVVADLPMLRDATRHVELTLVRNPSSGKP